MNIAHLLPTSAIFPLKKHNGRYEWALRLARRQAAAGHSVTVYTGEGSTDISSTIVWRSLLSETNDDKQTKNHRLIEGAFANSSHDIFHSHFDSLAFMLANHTSKPVVTTQHWFPTATIAENIRSNPTPNAIAVPVTNLMHREDRRLGIPTTDVIYHGIDLDLFKPQTEPHADRFLFVGRITPNKGVLETVLHAKRTGIQLDIVGKINESDKPYWDSILPYVDGDIIRYLGPKTQPEVVLLMASAKAMIFMPQTPEAFGQTIIEAQACGAPIVINDMGANSELVQHGRTGYICVSDEEFTAAIHSIDDVSRDECVAWAQSFDINTMVARYSELYARLLQR